MNQQRQSTLFQTWGKKEVQPHGSARLEGARNHGADAPSRPGTSSDGNLPRGPLIRRNRGPADIIDLCDDLDDEDAMLAQALEESLLYAQTSEAEGHEQRAVQPQNPSHLSHGSRTYTGCTDDQINQRRDENVVSVGAANPVTQTSQSLTQIDDLPGFDKAAGKIWIYPTNYPVRDYQFNIVGKALFKNTLVTLPTGLGKTFIAAVIMYNFYRWYPQGKIVFMAPTKPLVAQQIEACYNIMGIPQEDTAEMTGTMVPSERLKAWNYKRVFFLTPQVLTNDLSRGACPAEEIKCLVIDEAHKALGNHAYCQVVRELVKYTRDFRVLALSATPGSDIKAVQQVLANLVISHIELRMEESIDIQPYVHERKVDKIVIPLGQELAAVKEKYIRVIDVIVRRLIRQRVLYNRQTTSLSKFLILKARDAFRQNPPPELQRTQYGVIEGDFAMAMSLYHGYELLQLHGLKSLHNFLEGLVSGDKGSGRTRSELMRNADFNELFDELQGKFASSSANTLPFALSQRKTPNQPFVSGHPKIEKLKEVVLEHFEKFQSEPNANPEMASTRIMIFSQYRDSVNEITDLLSRYRPTVKVMSFIGQSSAGKATKGFTQKEQLKVMKKFREGGYNTLVSTCVGEEGLDIGDVDLIICFDANKSPIRLVQRMGRTGRKRQGRIVMLVTEGKEEQIYNQSQYSKKSIHKAILNGTKSLQFYPHSPRMVPDNLQPVCHKMHITIQHEYKSVHKEKKAGESNKTQKITGMLGKKCQNNDGFLSESELQYWNDHFKVPQEDVPKLPTSDFYHITQKCQNQPEEIVPRRDQGPVLRLNEWMPWQNRKHVTQLIDHSVQASHLVEMMEFIDLQQVLGPSDDAYGVEMTSYLDYDDVLLPGETNNRLADGILKFCARDDGKGHRGNLLKGLTSKGSKKSEKCKTKQRRSEMLPQFDSDVAESNSDNELPPFLGNVGAADNLASTETTMRICDNLEDNGVEVRENVSIDQMAVCKGADPPVEVDHLLESKPRTNIKAVAARKKGKGNVKPQSKRETSKAADVDGFVDAMKKLEKRKKRRKRLSSGNKSVVEIILGDDDSDFDVPGETKALDKAGDKRHVDVSGDTDVQGEPHPMEYSPNKTLASENDKGVLEQTTMESTRLSQLLPDFTTIAKSLRSPMFLNSSCERADQRFPTPNREMIVKYCVPSPPPIEEIEEIFASIGDKLPPIDLVQLVDEWEKEKLMTKVGISSTQAQDHNSSVVDDPQNGMCNSHRKVKMSIPFYHVRASLESRLIDREVQLTTKGNSRPDNDLECVPLTENAGCMDIINEQLNMSNADVRLENEVFVEAMDVGDEVTSPRNEPGALTLPLSEAKAQTEDLRTPEYSVTGVCREKSSLVKTSDESICSVGHFGLNISPGNPHKFSEDKFAGSAENIAEVKSTTHGLKTEISNIFADEEEALEDYGKWTLQITDFDEDFTAAPQSPNRKNTLPFQAYSCGKGSKVIPPAPATPSTKADIESPEVHDDNSLFEDCSILANMNTPRQSATLSAANTQKSPASKCTTEEISTHQSTEEESQFTFTQALACLHDSPAPTQGNNRRSTQPFTTPTHNTDAPKPKPVVDSPPLEASSLMDEDRTSNGLSFPKHAKPEAVVDLPPLEASSTVHTEQEQTNISSSLFMDSDSDENDDMPQFDLGFNFDDIDVVPPSPARKLATSQMSKCSQSMVFGKKRLSTICSEMKPSPTTQSSLSMDNWENSTDDCFAEALDDILEGSVVVSPSPARKPSSSRRSSKCSQSMVFGKKRLGEMKPNLTTTSFSNRETLIEDGFAESLDQDPEDPVPKISQPFISTRAENFTPQKIPSACNELKTGSVTAASSPLVAHQQSKVKPLSPVLSPVASPVKDFQGDAENQCPSPSDSEDSFCVVRKKGRKVAIIDSPVLSGRVDSKEEQHRSPDRLVPEFKTPTRPRERPVRQTSSRLQLDLGNLKNVKSSSESEDDTGLLVPVRQTGSRQRIIPPLSTADYDDFQDTGKDISRRVTDLRSETRLKSIGKPDHPQKKEKKHRKVKRSAAACGFIEYEAELSDDGASGLSGDEFDGSDEDAMLDGFINDATQLSQMTQSHDVVDDKAMYLRSVRSPLTARGTGRYRLHHSRHHVMDVFSQPPPEDESEYMEDSFCVDDDLEETGYSLDSDEEISYHQSPVNKKAKQNKKTLRKQQKMDNGNHSNGRKRIVTMIDSSSDEESNERTHDVSGVLDVSAGEGRPNKRAKVLSSTDDEVPAPNNEMNSHVMVSQQSPPLLSLCSRLKSNISKLGGSLGTGISNSAAGNSDNHGQKLRPPEKDVICDSRQAHGNTMYAADYGEVIPDMCQRRKICTGNQNSSNVNISHTGLKDKSSAALREERLRRQREKQEEFRRKLAEQNQLQNSGENVIKTCKGRDGEAGNPVQYSSQSACSNRFGTSDGTRVAYSDRGELSSPCDSHLSFTRLQDRTDARLTGSLNDVGLADEVSLLTSPVSSKFRNKGKVVVLVDSREITSGQEVVSCLRMKHQLNVVVRQLAGCDYIVSNRLAVERKQWSDFASGANRSKLQDRIQHMCSLFDRQCLIIEKDRIKPGEEKSARPPIRTKYVDTTLALLAQSSVRLFFTDTQEETAELLASICKVEERKGMAITHDVDLDPLKEQMMKFFLSIPKVSFTHALNLCYGFRNLAEFTRSSVKAVETKAQMSESRARDVVEYIHHQFCATMVPASRH